MMMLILFMVIRSVSELGPNWRQKSGRDAKIIAMVSLSLSDLAGCMVRGHEQVRLVKRIELVICCS